MFSFLALVLMAYLEFGDDLFDSVFDIPSICISIFACFFWSVNLASHFDKSDWLGTISDTYDKIEEEAKKRHD